MKVLITGGAGYIGSTIASCCVDNGITPVILDDLSKGLRTFAEPYSFYEGDCGDASLLDRVFTEHPDIEAVVHCAAKIVVPESVAQPLDYYENNVAKPIVLLQAMERHGVETFILSSSASLYEPGQDLLVHEGSPVNPQSPYAASKWLLERILEDTAATGRLKAIALRYFNPIGADPQLRTGLQILHPTHALGKMIEAYHSHSAFTVTGVTWPTRDGSGLRDYIHVWDLARAHVCALQRVDDVMARASRPGFDIINLGTGTGTTVIELVNAFGEATGTELPYTTADPRPGDVVGCATLTDKARQVLGWSAELSLADGVRDSLAWAEKLPAVLEEEAGKAERVERS
ncbi:UDP-glucose 4-epimerase GalE [Corynebacterium uropygiale]|uniref:UDP-glucose 4-epimerase n=1 Tax=Corynebacterium uropygiale TaxID=1775911 RepID=A0A9X1QQQ0_9CORY|nr:UDP-glucose 4-epimerase GalE [Corynebacterium uropygiale]MCF4007376.1 UDP-glucose 4-epimerase GalE [Corynebacterium uropygiale]